MGVGVYSSDFDGTGHTFLVSGPLTSKEDYAAYVNAELANLDIVLDESKDNGWNWRLSSDPVPSPNTDYWLKGSYTSREDALEHALDKFGLSLMDEDEFAQEEYDQFNLALIECIEKAAKELEFSVEPCSQMPADREFAGVVDDVVQIGWRSWETDFVVGVAAGRNQPDCACAEDIDWDSRVAILENFGISVTDVQNYHEQLTVAVGTYLRTSLANANIECRYKTSGYTSAPYAQVEQPDVDQKRLREEISALVRLLDISNNDPQRNFHELSAEKRIAFIRDVESLHRENNPFAKEAAPRLALPVIDIVGNKVLTFCPFENYSPDEPFVLGNAYSAHSLDDKPDFFTSLAAVDGLAALSRDGDANQFIGDLQRRSADIAARLGHPPRFYVTAGEFAQAISQSVILEVPDLSDDEILALPDDAEIATHRIVLATPTPQSQFAI